MTGIRSLLLGLGLVAAVQTGVLASMVVDRTLLLRNGREIVLPVIPVDPRDLFRGDYVRLGYEISNVPAIVLVGAAPHRNAAFYVTLAKNPAGGWTPVRVSRDWPKETDPERIVLKARSQSQSAGPLS